MPRGPRLDAPGLVHHVIVRGNERRRIFEDDRDYEAFCRRLDRLIPELGFLCFAWVLMSNHVHLALMTGEVALSRLMARLGTSYARYFNGRHGRVGHLVENRFKSRIVGDDDDLLNLILYIHANPLRAGLLPNGDALAQFPWCGHGALCGTRPPRPFEAAHDALALFAEDPAEARRRVAERMGGSPPAPVEPPPESSPAPPRGATAPSPDALEPLIEQVCRAHGIARSAMGSGRRGSGFVEARREIARRGVCELGLSNRAIARALGVSETTVSRALQRPFPPRGKRTERTECKDRPR